MAQRVKAVMGTPAIVGGAQATFTLKSQDFKYGKPVVSIQGLATTETASFWYMTNGVFEELDDGTGTQVSFTATYAADVFNGPGTYGVTKDVTAAICTLSVDDGR